LKKILFIFSFAVIGISACHKSNNTGGTTTDFPTLEGEVIQDFTNDVVFSQYSGLLNSSLTLQNSIGKLNTTPNDANLEEVRTNWKAIRAVWEQTEGFLIGPVESSDYDPNTDTWPTDYVQMDSLLASNNPLTTADVKELSQSLRGYHPLEYMIWGVGGSKKSTDLTARQKLYMVSLIDDIRSNNVEPLYNDWFTGTDNYKTQVLNAGKGSTEFPTRQALFQNIVSAMGEICEEVGAGKMKEPFIAKDSTITESPYSSNTLIDFKNNILGLKNVYMGLNGGRGIHDLVAAKQLDLDQKIQNQINAALNSFDQITERYEQAIYTQRIQVQNTMDQLDALAVLLDSDLQTFIVTNVKD
jgi:putative iron-regulated protein